MIRHLLSKPVDFYLHIILHIPVLIILCVYLTQADQIVAH